MVAKLAHLSSHLQVQDSRGRGGSFRRRKSRSRSPSVLHMQQQQRSVSPSPHHMQDETAVKAPVGSCMAASMTTTTTTITTSTTTVTGPVTSTTSALMDSTISGGYPGEYGDELRSPMKGEGAFADTVTDLVDIVKYETSKRGRARCEYSTVCWLSIILNISFHCFSQSTSYRARKLERSTAAAVSSATTTGLNTERKSPT